MGEFRFRYSVIENFSETGLRIDKICDLYLYNCFFSRCISDTDCGGIYLAQCNSNITNVCFNDCKGIYGSSMCIKSNRNHSILRTSCFRCYSEKTSGDSINLEYGMFQVHFLNSTFSKSQESSALQLAYALESHISYFLGVNTEGNCQIEFFDFNNIALFEQSALINNTADSDCIYVNHGFKKANFKNFVFSGNNNVKCFSTTKNMFFEECTYLDPGPFGVDPLPAGVTTTEVEVKIGKEFLKRWCEDIECESMGEKASCGIFLRVFMLVFYLD